jgi:deoxyribodipyrimidine photo-lyase
VREVPPIRVSSANGRPVRERGELVLYWMIAHRRRGWSFALQRAAWWSERLDRPLVVVEALRCGYRWASDRLHRFVIEGMRDNRAAFARSPAHHLTYVEPEPGDGSGLLEALAERACVVVTDDWPSFFLPRMVAAAARRVPVALETVDGNGLLPMRAAPRRFERAVDFRRHLQRELPPHLLAFPARDPLRGLKRRPWRLPRTIARRWPLADIDALIAPGGLDALPIDHEVPPSTVRGGCVAGSKRLRDFITRDLPRFVRDARDVDRSPHSGLSPHLHFGHVGAHQVAAAVLAHEGWTPERLSTRADGRKDGWWGVSPAAEAFLDQLVTWRELGFNACHHDPRCADYLTLPAWARATLESHPGDETYPFARLEAAMTGDVVWDAAQRELRDEGSIHSYLRMLWGKRVLEWSPDPRTALRRLYALNDRWALDGRDPNSISGIMWTLGRYDHPWPPARPGFGTVRCMTSASTARKLRMRGYLGRHAAITAP